MKSFLIVLTLFSTSTIMARSIKPMSPIISKGNSAGHVHRDYAGTERCDLYSNKVVITKQLGFGGGAGDITVTETKELSIAGDLYAVLELAKNEKTEEQDNFMCDGPHTSISGTTANDEVIPLFTTGGCGSPSISKSGAASYKLIQIINAYCPVTYSPVLKFKNL